ncbi:hypothetical protein AYJ58_05510 [Shewanella sp. Pdp11]|nr:hypothetical protein AYJ58_05510 [Shewanella sp. Pdp11]
MHVTSLGAAREIQEGIAVDPLLVGCGVKPHDFDPNEVWIIYFAKQTKRRLSAFSIQGAGILPN